MNKFVKSKIGKFFLYAFICVFVFVATNLLIGWLHGNYEWLKLEVRPAIFLFVLLNLYIDIMVITRLHIEIEFME